MLWVSLAKIANNVKSAGMSVDEMRAALQGLEESRQSEWKLCPTVIRFGCSALFLPSYFLAD